MPMDDDAKSALAMRSRGTPRIANRLFRRVLDFAQFNGEEIISKERTIEALDRLKVDQLGLDDVDHKYLLGIIHRFKGGPGRSGISGSFNWRRTTNIRRCLRTLSSSNRFDKENSSRSCCNE